MAFISARIQEEPALFYGLVNALIALAISFGLQLNNAQIGAVMAVVAIVLAILTRTAVTPNGKVATIKT